MGFGGGNRACGRWVADVGGFPDIKRGYHGEASLAQGLRLALAAKVAPTGGRPASTQGRGLFVQGLVIGDGPRAPGTRQPPVGCCINEELGVSLGFVRTPESESVVFADTAGGRTGAAGTRVFWADKGSVNSGCTRNTLCFTSI